MPNSNSKVTWTVWQYMETSPDGERLYYGEGNCQTTDTKPTENIYNGSFLFELNVNTGKLTPYIFDYASQTWIAIN